MTVLMTLRVSADPQAIEDTPSDVLHAIREKAKSLGVTKHHFYGSDKEVFVVDEWPDEADERLKLMARMLGGSL